MKRDELLGYADLYKSLYEVKYGSRPLVFSFPKFGSVCKKLSANFTKSQIKLIIFQHFEWRGLDGNEDREYYRLYNNCFPFLWIMSNLNKYVLALEYLYRDTWSDEDRLSVIVENLEKNLNRSLIKK